VLGSPHDLSSDDSKIDRHSYSNAHWPTAQAGGLERRCTNPVCGRPVEVKIQTREHCNRGWLGASIGIDDKGDHDAALTPLRACSIWVTELWDRSKNWLRIDLTRVVNNGTGAR